MVLSSCPEYLEDRSDDRGEKRGKVGRILGTGVGRSSERETLCKIGSKRRTRTEKLGFRQPLVSHKGRVEKEETRAALFTVIYCTPYA